MTALDALSVLTLVVFAPLLVWLLGRTGWSGDRKRVVVLAVAALIAALQAVLTGVLVVPEGWEPLLERVLISAAGFVTLNQAVYSMLWSKLPDNAPAADPVAAPVAQPASPANYDLYAGPPERADGSV